MKKVVKFGGSSLASADQFRKVGNIIHEDPYRRYVIPSAPGKRHSKDTKVTDLLYRCYDTVCAGRNYHEDLFAIKSRYQEIIRGLNLDLDLSEEFNTIEQHFLDRAGRDYAASRGEYLNGMVLAAYLGYDFVDSAEVICFTEDGEFDAERTNRVLSARLMQSERAVVPGFYGAMPDGTIKTFSRGGSDITGAIVARAVQASIYENWTDVSGFLLTDPHIVKDPVVIRTITYKELRELSYMGASVLHDESIFPVRKAGIPINIRNTNAPEEPGTMIVKTTGVKSPYTITGIAGKKGFVAINIEKDRMNSEIGFGRKVLEAFEHFGISFEHMPSGIDTLSVFVSEESFAPQEQAVLAMINRNCQPDIITIDTDLALIAVVGRSMKDARGTAGRVFASLAHARINVRMIDQGSDEENIVIGVKNDDFESAIRAIYQIFVDARI
ncbi:MAG: aspartate kinase [Lachnospiraceae bacterium]|nr:aspartate kinase [Lachnospiraceae bacterium]